MTTELLHQLQVEAKRLRENLAAIETVLRIYGEGEATVHDAPGPRPFVVAPVPAPARKVNGTAAPAAPVSRFNPPMGTKTTAAYETRKLIIEILDFAEDGLKLGTLVERIKAKGVSYPADKVYMTAAESLKALIRSGQVVREGHLLKLGKAR